MSISKLTGNSNLMLGGFTSGNEPKIKELEDSTLLLINQYRPNHYSSISAASAQNLLKNLEEILSYNNISLPEDTIIRLAQGLELILEERENLKKLDPSIYPRATDALFTLNEKYNIPSGLGSLCLLAGWDYIIQDSILDLSVRSRALHNLLKLSGRTDFYPPTLAELVKRLTMVVEGLLFTAEEKRSVIDQILNMAEVVQRRYERDSLKGYECIWSEYYAASPLAIACGLHAVLGQSLSEQEKSQALTLILSMAQRKDLSTTVALSSVPSFIRTSVPYALDQPEKRQIINQILSRVSSGLGRALGQSISLQEKHLIVDQILSIAERKDLTEDALKEVTHSLWRVLWERDLTVNEKDRAINQICFFTEKTADSLAITCLRIILEEPHFSAEQKNKAFIQIQKVSEKKNLTPEALSQVFCALEVVLVQSDLLVAQKEEAIHQILSMMSESLPEQALSSGLQALFAIVDNPFLSLKDKENALHLMDRINQFEAPLYESSLSWYRIQHPTFLLEEKK